MLLLQGLKRCWKPSVLFWLKLGKGVLQKEIEEFGLHRSYLWVIGSPGRPMNISQIVVATYDYVWTMAGILA